MGGTVVDRGTLKRTTYSLVTGTISAITYVYGFMDDHTICGGSDGKLSAASEASMAG